MTKPLVPLMPGNVCSGRIMYEDVRILVAGDGGMK